MKIPEIVYGGVWVASAIAVAGYTYTAATGEYVHFPTIGTAGPSDHSSNGGFLGNLLLGSKSDPLSPAWFANAASTIWNGIVGSGNAPAQKRALKSNARADPRNYAR